MEDDPDDRKGLKSFKTFNLNKNLKHCNDQNLYILIFHNLIIYIPNLKYFGQVVCSRVLQRCCRPAVESIREATYQILNIYSMFSSALELLHACCRDATVLLLPWCRGAAESRVDAVYWIWSLSVKSMFYGAADLLQRWYRSAGALQHRSCRTTYRQYIPNLLLNCCRDIADLVQRCCISAAVALQIVRNQL